MKKVNFRELEMKANELLSCDEEGIKLLKQENELDVKIMRSGKKFYVEREEINSISDLGEGSLRYSEYSGVFYIDRIDSNPSGCGIGSLLFDELECIAYEENIGSITARVSSPNEVARKFFYNRGFKDVKTDWSVFPPEILIKKNLFDGE